MAWVLPQPWGRSARPCLSWKSPTVGGLKLSDIGKILESFLNISIYSGEKKPKTLQTFDNISVTQFNISPFLKMFWLVWLKTGEEAADERHWLCCSWHTDRVVLTTIQLLTIRSHLISNKFIAFASLINLHLMLWWFQLMSSYVSCHDDSTNTPSTSSMTSILPLTCPVLIPKYKHLLSYMETLRGGNWDQIWGFVNESQGFPWLPVGILQLCHIIPACGYQKREKWLYSVTLTGAVSRSSLLSRVAHFSLGAGKLQPVQFTQRSSGRMKAGARLNRAAVWLL